MADEAYLLHDGTEIGPFSASLLRGLAAAGRIRPDDLIKKGLDGEPVPAGKIAGLVEAFERAASREVDTSPQTAEAEAGVGQNAWISIVLTPPSGADRAAAVQEELKRRERLERGNGWRPDPMESPSPSWRGPWSRRDIDQEPADARPNPTIKMPASPPPPPPRTWPPPLPPSIRPVGNGNAGVRPRPGAVFGIFVVLLVAFLSVAVIGFTQVWAWFFAPGSDQDSVGDGVAAATVEMPPTIVRKDARPLSDKRETHLPSAEACPPPLSSPFGTDDAQEGQRRWAEYLRSPVELTNSIGMKLMLVPPGEFSMGSAETQAAFESARPIHRVRITKPFYLGAYELTQDEFQKVMGFNPSRFTDDPRLPVESATWDQGMEFLKKLSEMAEEAEAQRKYRLPTEAEWEYACRAGTTSPFYLGKSLTARQANVNGPLFNNGDPLNVERSLKRTTRAGSYPPNAFGLYDMYGNVCEPVSDWYDPQYFPRSPTDDPKGPGFGDLAVVRGGSWLDGLPQATSAYRDSVPRTFDASHIGFRVVAEIPSPPQRIRVAPQVGH